MKRPIQTIAVLIASAIFIILIAGCQEDNTSNTKKNRLIAIENNQLKKDLAQSKQESKKQKELLRKCVEEKQKLQELAEKNINEQVEGVLGVIMEELAQIRQENEKLKAQVKELEEQLQNAKPSGPKPL